MNIAKLISRQAAERPFARAVVFPESKDRRGKFSYTQLTFGQLEMESDYLAWKLSGLGVKNKSRVLLFVRPSLEFSVLTFALFKIGAIPVFIDPGMGRKNLLTAIARSRPDTLIAVSAVHWMRYVFPEAFANIRIFISVGSAPGALNLRHLLPDHETREKTPFTVKSKLSEDQAAILFTSGGTGKPKGVEYSHGIFAAQVRLLQNMFTLTPEDVDMPAFPLFSLMTLAMGVCSVIPPMNPVKPARADPALMVRTILDQGVTTAAGSPAIWERVAVYCRKEGLILPTLRSLMMFGAPVSRSLLHEFEEVMPFGNTYTPYGATECLPVTCISGADIRKIYEGKHGPGTCVGLPVAETTVRIISPRDRPIGHISDVRDVATGETGEILVKGPQVTPSYVTHPEETVLAKVKGDNGEIWHRMGDLGYLDLRGRLWFCGRKTHRVSSVHKTWDSVPSEEVFNGHPDVKRTALVGLGDARSGIRAALVIERKDEKTVLSRAERSVFKSELKKMAELEERTRDINEFYLHRSFPVDLRHNIKIDRLKLAALCRQEKMRQL